MDGQVNEQVNGLADGQDRGLEIAIIGAGLAGTLLALSLSQNPPLPTLRITIYESRAPDAPSLPSGIILTPNGLTILSKLNIYPRIKSHCWTNAYRTNVNTSDEITKRVLVASEELHGFQNHRLYRRTFLNILLDMCNESPTISINYNSRFETITSDTPTGVSFLINNTNHHADLLFGADGINSSIRTHLFPSITPIYTGTTGILAHIPSSSVSWPTPSFPRQCTIQSSHGAIFLQPETPDATEIMVGTQLPLADMSKSEWNILSQNQDFMVGVFRRNYHLWNETARSVIDSVTTTPEGRGSLYLWPFMRMGGLPSWSSESGRVVLVGDAAHAVPPSSGQGVNLAIEDVWTLSRLLRWGFHTVAEGGGGCAIKEDKESGRLIRALRFWRDLRNDRVELVYRWSVQGAGVARMSGDERERLVKEGKIPKDEGAFDDMGWLYDFSGEERKVEAFIREEEQEGG